MFQNINVSIFSLIFLDFNEVYNKFAINNIVMGVIWTAKRKLTAGQP